MRFLVIDFETTGVDPENCLPLEFACVLYDTITRHRSRPFSKLIWEKNYPKISEAITTLTGLTDDLFDEESTIRRKDLVPLLKNYLNQADVLCAYNIGFDGTILNRLHKDADLPELRIPWFCAMNDLEWPDSMQKCRKLTHRALDLGLYMDNREKHRALADVNTVLDMLDTFDMERQMEYWKTPFMYLAATVKKPWEDSGLSTDLAKAHGFGWEKAFGEPTPKFPKQWVKKVKVNFDLSKFPFPTVKARSE